MSSGDTGALAPYVHPWSVVTEPDRPVDPTVPLCDEASDPLAAVDTTFLHCAIDSGDARSEDPEPTDELTVVAWNIERGFRVDDQLQVLSGGRGIPAADVVLLSEVDRGCGRTDARHIARDLAEGLGMAWVYGVEFVELGGHPDWGGGEGRACEHGNAILSRYPLGNVDWHIFEANASWYGAPGEPSKGGEPRLGGRSFVVGDVALGERWLHVSSIHFESRVEEREVQGLQGVETAEESSEQPLAALVGGDTNAWVYTVDLERREAWDDTTQAFFDRGFDDLHDGLQPGARATADGLVLDLMFGLGVEVVDVGVCADTACEGLSDHLPVWATVRVPPSPR